MHWPLISEAFSNINIFTPSPPCNSDILLEPGKKWLPYQELCSETLQVFVELNIATHFQSRIQKSVKHLRWNVLRG